MRGRRVRAALVVLLSVLYAGGNIVSAFAECCRNESGRAGLMECCLKGGPDHVCPFMVKPLPNGEQPDGVKAHCPTNHEAMPASGIGVPPEPVSDAPAPDGPVVRTLASMPGIVDRDLLPPTPPPRD